MTIQEEELNQILEGLRNNRLMELGLRYRDITLPQITRIAKELLFNTSLISLDLECNRTISCEGAELIAEVITKNRSLIYLNLGECSILDKGAAAIARALIHNQTLLFLNLRLNTISDNGAKAIAEALKINQTLMYLSLVGNAYWLEGIKTIAEALRINRSLISIGVYPATPLHITYEVAPIFNKALVDNKTLVGLDDCLGKSVDLSKNCQIRDEFLESLRVAVKEEMSPNSLSQIRDKMKTTPMAHQIYALIIIITKEKENIEMIR